MLHSFILCGLGSFGLALLGVGQLSPFIALLLFAPLAWGALQEFERRWKSYGPEIMFAESVSVFAFAWLALSLPFLRAGVTEGDSIMYHVPLAVNHWIKLTAPIDNVTAYYPHLWDSFLAPLVAVFGDKAYIMVNLGMGAWLASIHPLAVVVGYLAWFIPCGKSDFIAMILVAMAYRSKGRMALGIAAGAAYSCKMTSLIFILPLLARKPKAIIPAALVALPWALNSFYHLGNPVFPMFMKSLLSPMWTAEMASTFGATGNWIGKLGYFPRAVLYACPMLPLLVFASRPRIILEAAGLAFLLLPPDARYLVPLGVIVAVDAPRMGPRARWMLCAAGLGLAGWNSINREVAPIDGQREAWKHPEKILTIGDARKWPNLMNGCICQGLNDSPVVRDVARQSFDMDGIEKRLVRQRGIRTLLWNKTICANWTPELAKFPWGDRELVLWANFVMKRTAITGISGTGDTRTGEIWAYEIKGKGVIPALGAIPGIDGEVWRWAKKGGG